MHSGLSSRATNARLAVLAVAAGLAGAACVPGRDNLDDPSRRPQAALQVADWNPAGGSCPEGPLPPGVNAVDVAPIGHCLVLDARGTTDPQGGAGLRYAFEGEGITAGTSMSGTFVLPPVERLALPLDTVLRYTVTVTDPGGSISTSPPATVLLTNERPTVEALRDFRLPAGGFPWRPGQPFDVAFEASGEDLDGDDLQYCWELTDGTSGCVGEFGAFLATIDVIPQRLVASVRAFDGKSYSLPDTQSVIVAAPNPWTAGLLPGSPLASVDGSRRAIPSVPSLALRGSATLLDPPSTSEDAIVSVGADAMIRLTGWPLLTVGAAASIDYGINETPAVHPLADGARGRVWAAGIEFTPGQRARYVAQNWTVDPGATSLTPSLAYTTQPAGPGYAIADNELGTFPMAVLSSAGEPWLARTFGTEVVNFDAAGTVFVDTLAGYTASGLAARPGTGEIWVAATAGGVTARLFRYLPDRTRTELRLASAGVQGLAFADRDRVWLTTTVHGLVLLDVEALLAAAEAGGVSDSAFEAAIELSHPDVFMTFDDGPTLASDSRTGAAYLLASGDAWHAETNGFLESFTGTTISFVDPAGVLYFEQGGALLRGSRPAANGVAATSPQAREVSAAYDWRGGGVWAPIATSPDTSALLLVDPSGAPNRTFGGVVVDASTNPDTIGTIPALVNGLAAAADGSTLWAATGLSPLTGDPTQFVAFRMGEAALPILVPFAVPQASVGKIRVVEPLAPLSATGPARKAWVVEGQQVSLFDATDAGMTPRYTIPDGASSFASSGSRSLRSNDLCFATSAANADPTTVTLRRLTTAGAPSVFASESRGPFALVDAASDAEHDACWFATVSGSTWTFRAWAANGMLLHSTTSTVFPTSLHAESAHSLLVNRNGTVVRLQFAPATGGALLGEETLATGVNPLFARR